MIGPHLFDWPDNARDCSEGDPLTKLSWCKQMCGAVSACFVCRLNDPRRFLSCLALPHGVLLSVVVPLHFHVLYIRTYIQLVIVVTSLCPCAVLQLLQLLLHPVLHIASVQVTDCQGLQVGDNLPWDPDGFGLIVTRSTAEVGGQIKLYVQVRNRCV